MKASSDYVLADYVLEPLREGGDFTLYRGRQHGNLSPVLVIALSAEQPSPQSLRRLEHEYSVSADLDPAWAARPLALTRHEGRTILVLEDPGGEPLDRILERDQGQPLDLTRFLRVAISLAKALGQSQEDRSGSATSPKTARPFLHWRDCSRGLPASETPSHSKATPSGLLPRGCTSSTWNPGATTSRRWFRAYAVNS